MLSKDTVSLRLVSLKRMLVARVWPMHVQSKRIFRWIGSDISVTVISRPWFEVIPGDDS